MKKNKYNYYRVLQSLVDGSWCDECQYPTNSQYIAHNRKEIKEDLKAYRINSSYPTRLINRRELNEG